jgi:hypothetical protein
VIRNPDELTAEWLSEVLHTKVLRFTATSETSNWSNQFPLRVELPDGTIKLLRLKVCLGSTFGRSEVDYYLKDYATLKNAPLVHCWSAEFEQGVGYHILLDDLSATYANRRDVVPTLNYGLAVAEALGRMHRHTWALQTTPEVAALDRYFAEIHPGIPVMELATGMTFAARATRHEAAMRKRLSRATGLTLLHGDLNPTNILTPLKADAPVYFLDRQPFDWSLTYGLAASDLAYFVVPWWPSETRAAHETAILRRWYDVLQAQDYSWDEARADWALSVEQCLHVPMEWCSKPETAVKMRWLWEPQLQRALSAMSRR